MPRGLSGKPGFFKGGGAGGPAHPRPAGWPDVEKLKKTIWAGCALPGQPKPKKKRDNAAWKRAKARKQPRDLEAERVEKQAAKDRIWEAQRAARAERDKANPISPEKKARHEASAKAFQAAERRRKNAEPKPVPTPRFDKLP